MSLGGLHLFSVSGYASSTCLLNSKSRDITSNWPSFWMKEGFQILNDKVSNVDH
jgi:hypothetical protein